MKCLSTVLVISLGGLFVQCTNAQQLGVYLSASFDSPNGNAYAYATTALDYSASYYYFVCTSINALAACG
jgi:hypothetical protein